MNKTILATLLSGAIFFGCSSDDEPTPEVPVEPISFSISNIGQLTVDENAEVGTVIGSITFNVENSDEDPIYTILNQTPAGALALNGVDIAVANSSVLDFETVTQISGQIRGSVEDAADTIDFSITINNVDETIDFPDANFKAALVDAGDIDTNNDGEISESEAVVYEGIINGSNRNISDATGIEYFTNVTRISLFRNNLTAIDVSKNTKVTQLLLEQNSLTSVDISELSVLVDFKCHSNNLTEANIANGNNANMTRMELQGNSNLTCIKVDALPVPDGRWLKDATAEFNTECD